ncbi:ATP-dependent DNA helicase [Cutaneotrichosporon oleaginosum]|uniref:ATP-dependent DNA helicase n=1 Tax=Cutaneotrichosporon oleaginosum TaxID=879819 RepID=A0A0J0XW20_9TREE|nr:ATP-dependent DNA helicase [Cutaneotrichosporon oleaginosum]KLT45266.1 ATP-dependent DNA helicase [Cutaneotrichosporon oleaginosum]
MIGANGELLKLTDFPLPPATPLPSTYPCQLGSQHERNNFRPRQFKRIPSATESQAALRRTLQKYWGHANFRGPQLDICMWALRGSDVLVVAPTGLGKSVCFQVPALSCEYGITVVVSPLLALMRDQVSSMRAKGIQAFQLSEKTDPTEIREIKRQLRLGHPQLRLLYVTPETLFSPKYTADFDVAYRQAQIARLVVDEAHVIDEWGSTFRPTYRKLGEFRLRYPSVPITALTASATSEVRNDMLTILNMPKTSDQGLAQWVEPFNRKNLFYEVRHQGGWDRQADIIDDLIKFIRSFSREAEGINRRHNVEVPCISGLVYCRMTANCHVVAEALNTAGISAMPFHAKLSAHKRNQALDDWKEGKVECIVATIAFGMGVDQPHVRYVVHYDMPKSFEGYYQETGRAGRDGHMSRCVLYYAREDARYLRSLIAKEAESGRKNGVDQTTMERAKLRMVNSFKALQHYAESISLCRHIAICRFFGEDIDEATPGVKQKYCDGMCDICSNRSGVYLRANQLNEECEVASPIIQPAPLEPSPDYFVLSGQVRNSLARLHASSALLPASRVTNLSPVQDLASTHDPDLDDDFTEQWLAGNELPTPLRTPAPMLSSRSVHATPRLQVGSRFTTPLPRVGVSAAPRPLYATPQAQIRTPSRLQTMDEVADEGLRSAVVILGDERTPEYAERKRMAREQAFKAVTPAREGGPLSFYNSGAPRKRVKIGSQFKTPFIDTSPIAPQAIPAFNAQVSHLRGDPSQATPAQPVPRARQPLFLPGPSQFSQFVETDTAPPARLPEPSSVSTVPDPSGRQAAIQKLGEALRLSLESGALAEEVLQHWGRSEVGDKRVKLLKKVARELELDIAKMGRAGEPYDGIIDETCAALKLVRDARGVGLVTSGRLGAAQDPRVERLRHVELCMQSVRVK